MLLFFLFSLFSPALSHVARPPHLREWSRRDLAPSVNTLISTPPEPDNLPNENNTFILTFRNTTRYENWKNTKFFPTCPSTTQSLSPQPNSPSKRARSAWARGQADFCSHLDPSKRWVILPTITTPAAYLPNWSVMMSGLVWPTIQLIWIGMKIWLEKGEDLNLDKIAFVGLLWDLGQSIYWIYETRRATATPREASWVSPVAWITILGYCIWLKERTDKRAQVDESFRGIRFGLVVACVAIASWMCFVSFGFMVARFSSVQLGSQSYTLLDSVSPLIEEAFRDSAEFPGDQCLQMIFNPRSPIYTDPAFQQMRILHLVQFICALVIWVVWIRGYGKGQKRAWTIRSILWCLPFLALGVVWTAILASWGTPFMWDERCGVVVVGMSSRWGYWDGQLKDSGYMLQIIRSALGL